MIHRLLQRCGLGTTRPIWSGNVPRQHDSEVTLHDYADRGGAHRQTAYGCTRRGQRKGRIAKVCSPSLWLGHASESLKRSRTYVLDITHDPEAMVHTTNH